MRQKIDTLYSSEATIMEWLLMTFLCTDPTFTNCQPTKIYYATKQACETKRDLTFLNFRLEAMAKQDEEGEPTIVIYCKTVNAQAELVNKYYLDAKKGVQ